MSKYYKRTYRNPREFFSDMIFLLKKSGRIRDLLRKKILSGSFRERLMLAVTSVYSCRYCSWVHAREAFRSGVNQEEVARLLKGSVDSCPEEEAVAVLYAQHWADSDTKPDHEAIQRLQETYGIEKEETNETDSNCGNRCGGDFFSRDVLLLSSSNGDFRLSRTANFYRRSLFSRGRNGFSGESVSGFYGKALKAICSCRE